jgi:hypothetical protein
LPFHRSINGLLDLPACDQPTAQQLLAEVQATPTRVAKEDPLMLGVFSTAHFEPFQPSASVVVSLLMPTDWQDKLAGQDTPLSCDEVAPLGFTGVAAAHFEPFQRWPMAKRLSPMPTDMQFDLLKQPTPVSSPSVEAGVGTADHFEPFHFSVSPAP